MSPTSQRQYLMEIEALQVRANELENDLYWHALNYRTAGITEAEAMWQELQACVERLRIATTHSCADSLSINRSEAQLMAGEMTANEWRTVAAVLRVLQSRMRSNAK